MDEQHGEHVERRKVVDANTESLSDTTVKISDISDKQQQQRHSREEVFLRSHKRIHSISMCRNIPKQKLLYSSSLLQNSDDVPIDSSVLTMDYNYKRYTKRGSNSSFYVLEHSPPSSSLKQPFDLPRNEYKLYKSPYLSSPIIIESSSSPNNNYKCSFLTKLPSQQHQPQQQQTQRSIVSIDMVIQCDSNNNAASSAANNAVYSRYLSSPDLTDDKYDRLTPLTATYGVVDPSLFRKENLSLCCSNMSETRPNDIEKEEEELIYLMHHQQNVCSNSSSVSCNKTQDKNVYCVTESNGFQTFLPLTKEEYLRCCDLMRNQPRCKEELYDYLNSCFNDFIV